MLIKQEKANIKYILIVIGFLFLIAGGILWCLFKAKVIVFEIPYIPYIQPPEEGKIEDVLAYVESLSSREAVVGKELVIRGRNFGSDKGRVEFYARNSLSGIQSKVANAEILSWSDNEIKIIVPNVPETDIDHALSIPYPDPTLTGAEYYTVARWEVDNRIVVLPDTREYIVKLGDSLIKIAKAELGNGGRYLEVIDLNKKRHPGLNESTILEIGMKLRLPKE